VFIAGSALVEFAARRRERRSFEITAWLRAGPVVGAGAARRRTMPAGLRQMLDDVEAAYTQGALGDGGLEHLVLEREERVRRPLNLARTMVRVGPSLGLLGTLIPMGSSLASMAAGNLEAMAGQMVVAFTSTIIGLATGTLAYVVAAARQTWVTETIREQRYLAEAVAREMRTPPSAAVNY
jgi:biopolymer transport protein ExbB/TolQ